VEKREHRKAISKSVKEVCKNDGVRLTEAKQRTSEC